MREESVEREVPASCEKEGGRGEGWRKGRGREVAWAG